MKPSHIRIALLVLIIAAAALGYLQLQPESGKPATPAASPAATEAPTAAKPLTRPAQSDGVQRIVQDASVKNFGKVFYRGPVDLSATIKRIRAGEKHSHRNDGSVFGNREGLLPRQPRGYYREYVHPTEGLNGPGPQRLVVGADGDWWYTPDHYESFVALGTEERR